MNLETCPSNIFIYSKRRAQEIMDKLGADMEAECSDSSYLNLEKAQAWLRFYGARNGCWVIFEGRLTHMIDKKTVPKFSSAEAYYKVELSKFVMKNAVDSDSI